MWVNTSGRVSKRRHSVCVRRLDRLKRLRKRSWTTKMALVGKTDMRMKNLKLYVENQIIGEENERLRKKALLLHQENQTLLAQIQKNGSLIPRISSEK